MHDTLHRIRYSYQCKEANCIILKRVGRSTANMIIREIDRQGQSDQSRERARQFLSALALASASSLYPVVTKVLVDVHDVHETLFLSIPHDIIPLRLPSIPSLSLSIPVLFSCLLSQSFP
ncbi:hypothetical protein QCA50_003711 [Cerrena zonata]|uniref:Uncharacterized protein n=1 Tax=Cerrena zonata TaxID=2478898 RepID=A0AAW0GWW5_9APHY